MKGASKAAMMDIALGLQDRDLQQFAASVSALHMGQWVEHPAA